MSSWDQTNRRQKLGFGLEKQKENQPYYQRLLSLPVLPLNYFMEQQHSLFVLAFLGLGRDDVPALGVIANFHKNRTFRGCRLSSYKQQQQPNLYKFSSLFFLEQTPKYIYWKWDIQSSYCLYSAMLYSIMQKKGPYSLAIHNLLSCKFLRLHLG